MEVFRSNSPYYSHISCYRPLAAGDYITVKTLVSGLSYPEGVAVDGSGNVFVSMSSPNDVVVELQLASVNFGTANVCPSGQTSPAPCSQTLALNYNITEGGALGTPKVLTGGVPSSDFSVAGGSTCSGAVTAGTTCAVNVTFTPTTPGLRKGAVEIVDDGGDVLASTNIYGSGIGGPQQFAFEGEQAFAQTANSIQLNGEASLSSLNHLLLTDGHHLNAAGSAFYFAPLNIQSFTTAFTFQLTHPAAEGITFTIQNVGPTALGATGGSLGYATIGSSVAIKFDLFNNFGEGPNSTDLYINGVPPTGPSLDLTSSGIDLHSGDPFSVHMTYSGTTLNMTITDTITLKSWSHAFMVDIPAAVGGDTAYVGFTASTGDTVARQTIDNWRFSNP